MAKTSEFKHPFTVGELAVNHITIQRPKTKDFIAVGTNPTDTAAADAALLSSLSGLPMTAVGQIDIDDWAVIRIHLASVWMSYFTTKEYVENPTAAEEAPQETQGNE
jgi:inactivated superfamily I helicase